MEPEPAEGGEPTPTPMFGGRQVLAVLALTLAVVLLMGIGGLIGYALHSGDRSSATMTPKDHGMMLDSLPTDVAAHYEFAAAHEGDYERMICYCGCQDSLGHDDLLDCFVRPTGGWEPHASGCVVCIQESEMVRHMLENGRRTSAIAAAIDVKFAGTMAT